MADMNAEIRFCFDYISSNAYLAWVRLLELEERYEARVVPVPVLFAGLLAAHGQLGPAEVLPKALWMARNNLRKAALMGLPLEPPRFHPYNPLLSLRASSLDLPEPERRRLIGLLFEGVWVRRLHVSEPDTVAALADEAGLDGADVVARAGEPDAKARLRRQTDEAIAAGVFGVPSMILEGEVFWGFDDLPYLEMKLAGQDPLDPVELARWHGRGESSAWRRQAPPRKR